MAVHRFTQLNSIRSPFAHTGCALFFAVLISPIGRAQDEEGLKQEFLTQAPAKWREYIAKCTRLQGKITGTHTSFYTNDKDTVRSYKWEREFKQSQNAALFRSDGKVVAINPKYGVVLVTMSVAASPDNANTRAKGPWQVLGLQHASDDHYEQFASVRDKIPEWAAFPAYFDQVPLPDLVERKDFSLRSVKREDVSGEPRVRVDFQSHHKSTPSELTEAWMILDPKKHWCICEYWVKFPHGDICSLRNEWNPEPTDPPLLRRTLISRPAERYQENEELIFDVAARNPSSEEFLISHFGLAEPEPTRPSKPPYLWAALAAFVCLLGLLEFWRLRKKRPATTEGAAPP